MKAVSLPSSLFVTHRQALAHKLPKGALAVLNANDIMPTNGDGTMPFRQNSDLYYMTGVAQEETILLLFPNAPLADEREILFIQEPNELMLKWDGHRLSKEQARELTGIKNVQYVHTFHGTFHRLATDADSLYLNTNEHKRSSNKVQTRDDRFIAYAKEQFPLHTLGRLAPIISRLRMFKSEAEIELLKEAIKITGDGLRRLQTKLAPDVMEYELQAELAHEFIRQGASFAGYSPIIASGPDACILHYIENSKACADGQTVLLDFGAGYGHYHADMTRVLPVNGKFSPRQKEVYNAVKGIFETARALMKPGTLWQDWQKATEVAANAACVGLGLYTQAEADAAPKDAPLHKQYFYHGVGHFLGLDVHDSGYFHEPFAPGMVLTCEPGLYIWAEGIGVRLENNIVITENGYRDLMEEVGISMEAEAFEK